MFLRGLEAYSKTDGAWCNVGCSKTKVINKPEGLIAQVQFRFSFVLGVFQLNMKQL